MLQAVLLQLTEFWLCSATHFTQSISLEPQQSSEIATTQYFLHIINKETETLED